MENIKKNNLVMPTLGYELDREEMSYVDGGLTISNSTCIAITGIVGVSAWSILGISSVAAAAVVNVQLLAAKAFSSVITLGSKIVSGVSAIPVVGVALATDLGVWMAINSTAFAEIAINIGIAAFTGQDVTITGVLKLNVGLS